MSPSLRVSIVSFAYFSFGIDRVVDAGYGVFVTTKLPPCGTASEYAPRCVSFAALKLHQRDDRSFALVVRDAETAVELARALIGGGDRCVLEEPSLAFVLPHARVEFDERSRFDRFKRLLMVSED